MKREKLLKLKYFIPAILVMIMIFCFSSQPKDITNGKSDSVIRVIKDYIPFIKNSFGGGALVFLVRKSAHIFEFTLLFLSFYYGFFKTLARDKSLNFKSFIYSGALTFIYACMDEYHQLFVYGRSGKFSDVLVDSIGIIIGSLILLLYFRIKRSVWKHSKKCNIKGKHSKKYVG